MQWEGQWDNFSQHPKHFISWECTKIRCHTVVCRQESQSKSARFSPLPKQQMTKKRRAYVKQKLANDSETGCAFGPLWSVSLTQALHFQEIVHHHDLFSLNLNREKIQRIYLSTIMARLSVSVLLLITANIQAFTGKWLRVTSQSICWVFLHSISHRPFWKHRL